jgi:hypothetical protein
MQLAVHQCGPLILFYVALITVRRKCELGDEVLFDEVANCKFVSVGEQVEDAHLANHVILQMVHHVGAIAFDLFSIKQIILCKM